MSMQTCVRCLSVGHVSTVTGCSLRFAEDPRGLVILGRRGSPFLPPSPTRRIARMPLRPRIEPMLALRPASFSSKESRDPPSSSIGWELESGCATEIGTAGCTMRQMLTRRS